jgi:hypothetical protein
MRITPLVAGAFGGRPQHFSNSYAIQSMRDQEAGVPALGRDCRFIWQKALYVMTNRAANAAPEPTFGCAGAVAAQEVTPAHRRSSRLGWTDRCISPGPRCRRILTRAD